MPKQFIRPRTPGVLTQNDVVAVRLFPECFIRWAHVQRTTAGAGHAAITLYTRDSTDADFQVVAAFTPTSDNHWEDISAYYESSTAISSQAEGRDPNIWVGVAASAGTVYEIKFTGETDWR